MRDGATQRQTGGEQAAVSTGDHDHLPLPYQSLDEQGRILDVNRCWLDTLGYTRSDVIGTWFGDLLPPGQQQKFKKMFPRFKEEGSIHGCELQLLKKDGGTIRASFNGTIAYRDDGSIEQTHCMFEDITALHETEERFRHLYENATVGLYRTTPDGRILMANPAAVDMLGYDSFEELAGRDLEDTGYEPGYPRRRFKEMIEEQGEVHGLESAWKRKDGSTIYVRESARAYYDDDGHIKYYEGSVEDITEQKEAVTQLRRHMENMEYIAGTAREFMELEGREKAYDYIASCIHQRVEDGVVIVNSYDEERELSRVEAVAGMDKKLEKISEVLGRHPVGMEFPIKGTAKQEMLSGRLMTGPSGLYELSAGTIPRPVAAMLDRLVNVNQIYGMGLTRKNTLYGNVVVITTSSDARVEPEVLEALIGQAAIWLQRHQAVQALRRSEKKYRTLFENMAQGVFYQRPDGTFVDVNQAALDMFGLTRSEFLNRDSTHPDWHVISEDGEELPPDERPSRVALSTGRPVTDVTVGVSSPDDDSYTWMSVNAIPQYREDEDEPYQVFVTLQDVTARKKMHDALADSKRELELTLNATTDGIWTWNFKTEEMEFSPGYYTMLGYEPGAFEPSFENWVSLIHPDDREEALETAEEYLETKPDHYENEFRLRTRDGGYRWIRSHARVVERNDDGAAVRMIGNHEDITERKRTHLELKQSLEEKKVLLREVHHRVKNNLQVISSMLQMESSQHDDLEARQALQDMQLRIKSMGLVHEHLYQSPELSHVDVQEYLTQLAHNVMQTYSRGEHPALDLDVQEMELPLDKAIPCGLVATELLSNAFRHAFPDGQAGTARLSARCSDGKCILTVSDDGVGMPEDTNGETLGLQLVDVLAAQLDGTVTFTGEEGTTATLTFAMPSEVTP